MSGEVAAGKQCLSCHISVEDAEGTVLLTIPFREVPGPAWRTSSASFRYG
jgi:hypothetical protein